MSKYLIENLTETDIDWFVKIACTRMLTEELDKPSFVNINNLYQLSYKVIKDQTAFIVKHDGLCVGAIAAMLLPNIYNPDIKTFVELFWYVIPEYRETRAGALLFKAFEKKAEECSDESVMSLLNSSDINFKTLERKGFILQEYAFRKEYRKT